MHDLRTKLFTPEVIDGHGEKLVTWAVGASACPTCKSIMLSSTEAEMARVSSTWGASRREDSNGFKDQLARSGLSVVSKTVDKDGNAICQRCHDEGRATFVCSGCNIEKPCGLISHTINGDPCDYLCVSCYEVMPAKDWDALVKELEDNHRWDFA